MEKPAKPKKEVPGRMTGLVGLLAFGAGAIGLIPAVLGLILVASIAWLGLRFVIGLFGILFS
ncbi:hypothetical protein [Herbaspirillum rubrisubalbicans]|uniref:Uncharacterized protein n=2 Tax=Herbaspirillum rubrisubalbicans TaxID=80842 RepID=A0AAD0UEZ3_9BURK|nr:hypothetical protein [Herbaspirillum rubrisubalbicans]AYR25764.1 hypothetical protein RC54_18965 [Herbaspirillum rubrisubalbicans]